MKGSRERDDLERITRALARAVDAMSFSSPVTHVYNPLTHARASFERYLERFARPGIEALWLGMNPGPFGMVQTGVPFGDVAMVRDWMGIVEEVGRPRVEHPRRPVEGFACRRSEVSGTRLWGWARDCFETPESFFERFFVWNWCPLAFLEESGRNRTPNKLPAEEREPLNAACDRALAQVVDTLAPRWVLGVGAFATERATKALAGRDVEIGTVLHPSPASPSANRGWAGQAEAQLRELGIRV
jgi:single-strand selective monofunctional uracil DNA glycosylase